MTLGVIYIGTMEQSRAGGPAFEARRADVPIVCDPDEGSLPCSSSVGSDSHQSKNMHIRHRSQPSATRSGWFAQHTRERWEKTRRLIGRTQIQQNDLEAVCRLASGGQIP